MRNSLLVFASTMALGIFMLAPEVAQAQCNHCDWKEPCAPGDHVNEAWDGITGNQDGTHGCYAYSCNTMQTVYNVHVEQVCEEGALEEDMVPLAEIQAIEHLSFEDAFGLLDAHPHQFVLNREKNVLQVLGCGREHVIAQFSFTPKPTPQ